MLATDLANYILKNAGKRLSNLELQKYIYLIEIEYIKKFDKHLIDDDFVAWIYGPIVEEVYWKFRHYGANSITIPNDEIYNNLNDDEIKLIQNTIENLNTQIYWKLVERTNTGNTAWCKTIAEKGKKAVIDKKYIFDEAIN